MYIRTYAKGERGRGRERAPVDAPLCPRQPLQPMQLLLAGGGGGCDGKQSLPLLCWRRLGGGGSSIGGLRIGGGGGDKGEQGRIVAHKDFEGSLM